MGPFRALAVDVADVTASIVVAIAVIFVVFAAAVATIAIVALYGSALVLFDTSVDVVVVAIVRDAAASGVHIVAAKPNVTDD